MKTLQDSEDKTYELEGSWPLKTAEYRPDQPKSLTLLLHGYNERGLRIFRKLKKALPLDTYIVAPNGVFPLPRVKPDRLDFGYAWYFYDRFTQSYHVDQKLVVNLISNLLKKINPEGLPVTVIGFSQGGYLAPLLGFANPDVKHVIGIGCEFRTRFFPHQPTFTLDGIHGTNDPVVNPEHAQKEIEELNLKNIKANWHPVAGSQHEISPEIASVVSQLMESYGKRSL